MFSLSNNYTVFVVNHNLWCFDWTQCLWDGTWIYLGFHTCFIVFNMLSFVRVIHLTSHVFTETLNYIFRYVPFNPKLWAPPYLLVLPVCHFITTHVYVTVRIDYFDTLKSINIPVVPEDLAIHCSCKRIQHWSRLQRSAVRVRKDWVRRGHRQKPDRPRQPY